MCAKCNGATNRRLCADRRLKNRCIDRPRRFNRLVVLAADIKEPRLHYWIPFLPRPHLKRGRCLPAPQALVLRLASAMTCSSCARSSGVRASPKSSASNTGRISILAFFVARIGAVFDPVDRYLQRGGLPEPVAGDQFLGLGERAVNDQAILPREAYGAPLLEGCKPSPASMTPAMPH